MAFSILPQGPGRLAPLVVENSATGEKAVCYPGYGGLLNELHLSVGDSAVQVLDGYADEPSLLGLAYSKGIKLSPFPNRIRDGHYFFREKAYQLDINKPNEHNAIHGFVQQADFQVEKTTISDNHAKIALVYRYGGERPGFPFPFTLRMDYQLGGGTLACTTTVTNEGSAPMPLGDGWHPYFTFGVPADALWLELPSQEYLVTDERMIPTLETRRLGRFAVSEPIGDFGFDTGFVLPQTGAVATTRLNCPARRLGIEFWQETGPGKYNFLQVYIPPSRNAVALEPMTCAADAFHNGLGLIELEAGETFEARYGVRLIALSP
jgi:aldose 1-epimerase